MLNQRTIMYRLWIVHFRVATGGVEAFTTTTSTVYHMEDDHYYIPGNIIYNERYSLRTSHGTGSEIIAGNTTLYGYREGDRSGA